MSDLRDLQFENLDAAIDDARGLLACGVYGALRQPQRPERHQTSQREERF